MDAIEKRARELLADQLDSLGNRYSAVQLRKGEGSPHDYAALRAIIVALTPPEGYVLVPVEPTDEMKRAFNGYRPIGRANFACRYEEMLTARPEVP